MDERQRRNSEKKQAQREVSPTAPYRERLAAYESILERIATLERTREADLARLGEEVAAAEADWLHAGESLVRAAARKDLARGELAAVTRRHDDALAAQRAALEGLIPTPILDFHDYIAYLWVGIERSGYIPTDHLPKLGDPMPASVVPTEEPPEGIESTFVIWVADDDSRALEEASAWLERLADSSLSDDEMEAAIAAKQEELLTTLAGNRAGGE